MKGIYFLCLVFILILLSISLTIPQKHYCMSQNFYYGAPGFVREGFNAGTYSHCYLADEKVHNNYPYFAATHRPTSGAIEIEKTTQLYNNAVSDYMAKILPKGNRFTINHPCRESPISYKNSKYKDCGAYPANSCNSII